ncbi:hypothetical protein HJC23_013141 [Cyclotella cryptica]|uniref:Ubiquitin-like domain-containing protein n=1 Tax=Cyclotella cryptica TaxID=29204 RepID=A0ABD3QPX3_9STRA|eukprot:CCRYP_003959-RA/>CCRYP_003959-RA protein AED:0.31 eAED:0.31 QI:0/-1/0/1/-1/1/1/0/570
MAIQTQLKWGKKSYNISIESGSSTADYKVQVQTLTGVPPPRQKLLCPKIWKGALKDEDNISDLIRTRSGIPQIVVVTVIGSTETLQENPPNGPARFLEDMTPDEISRLEMSQYPGVDGDVADTVDIAVLQKEPGVERHDGKIGWHQYSRFVTGLPQHEISDLLRKRKSSSRTFRGDQLSDTLAMTLGMELRRAYINSLAVLANGMVVSGLSDGHVQLWRRCQMVKDLKHAGCVDHVLTFPSTTQDDPAFITAGGGAICVWSEEGRRMLDLSTFQGTTPGSVVTGYIQGYENAKYLASCFRITREVNPNQFRLVPQNEEERQRRVEAEITESLIRNELSRVSKCMKVWSYRSSQRTNLELHEQIIECDSTVTHLEDMNGNLICGDEKGCITKFTWRFNETNQSTFSAHEALRLQLVGYQFSIALLKSIRDNILAVSVHSIQNEQHVEIEPLPSSTPLHVSIARGVLLVDLGTKTVNAVLKAHEDIVQCICPLPNGSVLTVGGKMDAKVCLWESNDIAEAIRDGNDTKILNEAKTLKEPGYVFDLKVLPDSDPTSEVFAIAGARYNVIKIVI